MNSCQWFFQCLVLFCVAQSLAAADCCEAALTCVTCGGLQEVCRSLGVELRGQTSASYNMRLNYERCLLEFEHYLATGQYPSDLAAGQAPSADVMQQPATARAAREPSLPPGAESASMSTRR